MSPEQIKAKMKERNLTQAKLARKFRKAPNTIHYLVNRKLKSEALDRRFARELGVTVEELRGDSSKAA